MPAVIYPTSIKTDKKKLFACYSLIQQMIDEHNRQAELMKANRKEYEAKFRTYQEQEFKPRLKQVLAERTRLIEAIRWANYTPEQWKAVSKLSLEDQSAIHTTLFGDKSAQKIKTTKATSILLGELKAISLDSLSEKQDTDPTEDFTTYIEYDEGSDITKTSSKITLTDAESIDDSYWVYKDKDSGHFDSDFEHLVTSRLSDSGSGVPYLIFWMLSNIEGDFQDVLTSNEDCLACTFIGGGYGWIVLYEIDGGDSYNDYYNNVSTSTVYYLTIERDEAVETYGTLYCYIYDDSDRTSLVDTLSIALHTSKKNFQYIYGTASYDTGGGTGATVTGYVEDLDLQEDWTTIAKVSGVTQATIGKINSVSKANIAKILGTAV